MKPKRLSVEQIGAVLKPTKLGTHVADLIRRVSITGQWPSPIKMIHHL